MRVRPLVAWNLRRLRVAKNLTQEVLGLLAGFEQSYVGRIERGRENTTIESLPDALGSTVSEFFIVPVPGAERPGTMRRGRKPKQACDRVSARDEP